VLRVNLHNKLICYWRGNVDVAKFVKSFAKSGLIQIVLSVDGIKYSILVLGRYDTHVPWDEMTELWQWQWGNFCFLMLVCLHVLKVMTVTILHYSRQCWKFQTLCLIEPVKHCLYILWEISAINFIKYGCRN